MFQWRPQSDEMEETLVLFVVSLDVRSPSVDSCIIEDKVKNKIRFVIAILLSEIV